MDLRSIVHAENTPDARKVPAIPPESSTTEIPRPPPVLYQPGGTGGGFYKNRTSNGQGQHDGRPLNPPPIHTASYHDSTSSRSPGGLTKQNSYTVARTNVDSSGPYPYPERGSASSSQGQYSISTPLTHTPTGSSPASVGAYSALQRPTSSHTGTPGSAHHQVSSSLGQRSPQAAHNHTRVPSQPQPPQRHLSQPHTPLGPPSGRPAFNVNHDSPSSYGHQSTISGGSHGQQYPLENPLVATKHLPSERLLSAEPRPREQSVSVSPKTRVDTLPDAQSLNASRYLDHDLRKQTAPVNLPNQTSFSQSEVSEREIKPLIRRSTSFAIEGLLNEAPVSNKIAEPEVTQTRYPSENDVKLSTPSAQQLQPVVQPEVPTPKPADRQAFSSISALTSNSSVTSEIGQQAVKMEDVPQDPQSQTANLDLYDRTLKHHLEDVPMMTNASSTISSLKSQPERKKPRLEDTSAKEGSPPPSEGQKASESLQSASQASRKPKRKREVPRFAQSVRMVWLPRKGHSKLQSKGLFHGMPRNASLSNLSVKEGSTQQNGNLDLNNETATNGTHIPTAQPDRKIGPLGPWEPSILDVEPVEDITKVISDWLFTEVVLKQEIGVGPAGGSASKGAVLEIEAKIGRLIDQNTNDRLRLPVATECVISPADPNLRFTFESSMTEAQHRTMNGFLNKVIQDSMNRKATAGGAAPPSKKRIPLVYRHTYESDRFFELSQQGLLALPRAVTENIDPRNRRKTTVRITNDQKTGKEIAKIVKARLADINVYSPRTLFDYRISVNVEMNFDGNMTDLVEPDRARGRKPDRNKDRMSYSHLAYRIDLTQVTPTEGSAKTEKEHELEVEVSSEEVRRQGLLVVNGQDHEYDKLIKGFLDNVRVLARYCQL